MSESDLRRICYDCGNEFFESQMKAIDISKDNEYYPRFIYVCYGCIRKVENN